MWTTSEFNFYNATSHNRKTNIKLLTVKLSKHRAFWKLADKYRALLSCSDSKQDPIRTAYLGKQVSPAWKLYLLDEAMLNRRHSLSLGQHHNQASFSLDKKHQ